MSPTHKISLWIIFQGLLIYTTAHDVSDSHHTSHVHDVHHVMHRGDHEQEQDNHEQESKSEVLHRILRESRYHREDRPPPHSDHTSVRIGFYMETLTSIRELDMDFTVSMYLRQEWKDSRLAHNYSSEVDTVDSTFASEIWVPNLYFVNGKEEKEHTLPAPNKLVLVHTNGVVFHSQKLTIRLYCGMNLSKFPFDEQECPVQMMSYSHNTSGIMFDWISGDKSVEVCPDMEIPEFTLKATVLQNCTMEYITGVFSCLEVTIYLSRRYMHYALQMYVPSALIVFLSWANFWIDHRSIPARVSLALLCILTITTQSSGIGANLPKVAYLKAIDVWMSVCLVFVFGAFVEFTIVNIMSRRVEFKQTRDLKDGVKSITSVASRIAGVRTNDAETSRIREQVQEEKKTSVFSLMFNDVVANGEGQAIIPPLTLDKRSRIIFPALFIVFNLIYWPYYLT